MQLRFVAALAASLSTAYLFAPTALNALRADDKSSSVTEEKPKPTPSGLISGRIVDDAGKPVKGAKVVLLRYHFPSHRFGHLVPVGSPAFSDEQGEYRFEKLADDYFMIDVKKIGYAREFTNRSIEKGVTNSREDITLQPPIPIIVELKDGNGQPVVGARLRQFASSGKNGPVRLPNLQLKDLELDFPRSDANGRVILNDFPANQILQLTFDHPTFAPVKLENITVAKGVQASASMKPGIVLTFRRSATSQAENISSAVLDLRNVDFRSPSTILHYEVEFDANGTGRVTIEPGDYNFLRLQHDDYFLTPTLTTEGKRNDPDSPLRFEAGKNVELTFEVHRRLTAKGRVIDAETGEPVAEESLLGRIMSSDPNEKPDKTRYDFTDWGETDAKGVYSLSVVAGRMRVEFHGTSRISETEYTDFDVAADGSTVIPDIKVRSLPKFKGIVRNPDGTPVKNVVVRFRGNLQSSSHIADPTVTDENGRFELSPKYVLNAQDGKRQMQYSILAFDAYRPLGAKIDVQLDKPVPVELTLEPHDFDWPLTVFPTEFGDWQRGIITPEQSAEYAATSHKGKHVPDLDCAAWINSDPLDWDKLQGKYVLLDFWFIACGPCQAELPNVRLLHELYHDKGLVVIGVHNNNDPPEKVRDHVKKTGLPFPIAVDHPDERTTRMFQSHKLVDGFPSYNLIDPQGNVLLDDRTIPHPTLRGYKLEIIRNLLFGQHHTVSQNK